MYRNQAWYDAFDISYDMSVPNAAQLDPQRGGCCTISLTSSATPGVALTTIQAYQLYTFYVRIRWRCGPNIEMIAGRHACSFIIHPD